ncbi:MULTISPECIES: winged helix-turn-helix domain-containing protein [unclassified Thioalkalivibrio]|uniref:winged helix-turn-helix domain-containing protein n=1 Tax=unclassified Thioalkalivibrio TaxID=2621013 RepID=UPI000375F9AA|nr:MULTISPECIES: LysR family transcriptional regulator [unclassified Thioalkalivibrio]
MSTQHSDEHKDPTQAPRLRVLLGEVTAMGPGKAMLLDAIRDKGSISAAARSVGMSYRRAWDLVETMNQSFREPVITTAKGGSGGGGAQITEFGETVLARYRDMERKACEALRDELHAFADFLAEDHKP